jgi:hypothetical protein
MDQDVGKGLRHGEIDSGLLPQRGIAYQPKGLPQEHAIKEILYPIGIAASSMLQQDTTRIRREASSVPCPNGGSLASRGVFGPLPQRGIAYQPRVQPWEHAIRDRCVLKERRIHPTQTDDPGIYGVPSERETWGLRSPGFHPISANIMMDARCDTMTIGHATIANLNR